MTAPWVRKKTEMKTKNRNNDKEMKRVKEKEIHKWLKCNTEKNNEFLFVALMENRSTRGKKKTNKNTNREVRRIKFTSERFVDLYGKQTQKDEAEDKTKKRQI